MTGRLLSVTMDGPAGIGPAIIMSGAALRGDDLELSAGCLSSARP